jgi:hypothetical protein
MRYSTSDEQNLKTSLILDFVQLFYYADGPKTQPAVC